MHPLPLFFSEFEEKDAGGGSVRVVHVHVVAAGLTPLDSVGDAMCPVS